VLTGMTMPKMNDSDHLSRNNLNSKEEPFLSWREKKQKLRVWPAGSPFAAHTGPPQGALWMHSVSHPSLGIHVVD